MSTATVKQGATLDAAAADVLDAPITVPEHEDDRPVEQAVFAAFCYEDPDSFIGQYVSQTAADLAENGSTVYLFARRHFPVDEPGVRTHAVGECAGESILGSVQEFTRRAANAFLRQFPAGTEGVHPPGLRMVGRADPVAPARSPRPPGGRVVPLPRMGAQRHERRDQLADRRDRAGRAPRGPDHPGPPGVHREDRAAPAARMRRPDRGGAGVLHPRRSRGWTRNAAGGSPRRSTLTPLLVRFLFYEHDNR